MSARLLCRQGALRGLEFEIGDEATVGRSSNNQIVIDAASVSNEHARIVRDETRDCYVLTDLGSTNGTELDGERVTTERLERLHIISFGHSGDFIFIDWGNDPPPQDATPPSSEEARQEPEEPAEGGETQFEEELPVLPLELAGPISDERAPDGTQADGKVVPLPSKLAAPATESAAPDRTVVGDAVVGLPKALAGDPPPAPVLQKGWVLEVELDDSSRLRLPLPPGEATIGRSSECTVQLVAEGLSRMHALVSTSGDSVRIRDLDSTNGTFVDDRRLEGDEEATLEAGDRVRFGATVATLRRVAVE